MDMLKGLAMIGVVLVHYEQLFQSSISLVHKVASVGSRCPQLFFVIAAYFVWYSLNKK